MKVGFLSIGKSSVDLREAKIALFDGGHALGPILTVDDTSEIDWALSQLRTVCDAIVIDGDSDSFYAAFKDRLSTRPENFELDGKLYGVTPVCGAEYIADKLVPMLNSKNKRSRYQVIVFKTFGKTEAELRSMLKDHIKSRSKIRLGFFPSFSECEVHARGPANMPQAEFNATLNDINQILYKCTYSFDRISIAERVAQMLREQGLKLKVAESFTGGAIARAFTEIPGASEYFEEGLVTYSVESKIKRLGVPPTEIAKNGVVSNDTAYRMAVGLLESGDCDLAIATTGNAGPTAVFGAVGLCFIAIGDRNEVHTMRYTFGGDRDENVVRGVKNALFLLYSYLDSREARETARAVRDAGDRQF